MAERYCAEKIFFHAGQRTLIDDVSLTLSQGELVPGNRRYCGCLPVISSPQADAALWPGRRLRTGRRILSRATGR